MTMSLDTVREEYRQVPHTTISSNEPYGVDADDPDALSARRMAMHNFVQGDFEWPQLEFPMLDQPSLDASERDYQAVLKKVEEFGAADADSADSQILYESVARKLAEVYRHKQIRRQLGYTATAQLKLSRQRAGNMSAELFGEVSMPAFRSILAKDIRQAMTIRQLPGAKANYADEYLRLLGLDDEQHASLMAEKDTQPSVLSREAMTNLRADLYNLFPLLESNMSEFAGRDIATPAAEAKPPFDAALDALGLVEKGWKVALLEGAQAANTDGPTTTISFGRERADFTPTAIHSVPVHEAIHAFRYQNGLEQAEAVRQRALPGSTAFEEGLATAFEQILTGVLRAPGEKYHLQLGLMQGLHLYEPFEQSFRSVYELMWRRAVLYEKTEPSETKDAELQRAAYRSVMRTSRGNARDNRDISYFNGAAAATNFLNETASLPKPLRLARLKWVLSGKFDPTRKDHAAIYGGDPAQIAQA